ncbi:MAG: hypothetical protein JXB49_04115 [Bacteroidales bacterium]|nr:hypothetical protein [Bacteroidales bacterium]
MKRRIIISILIFLFSLISNVSGQNLNTKDSLKACIIINDFFDWYLGAINKKNNSAYQPRFMESKIGYTSLDFKEYFKNLKKHHCSNTLIKNERESYNQCLKNLEEIPYSDFITQFTKSDQYEKIDCGLVNNHRWICRQESIQGIRIKTVRQDSCNQIKVVIDYYSDNEENNEIFKIRNSEIMILKLKNSEMKINSIDCRN